MNIAITNGLLLMPPAFRGGLNAWSRSNGTPGSPPGPRPTTARWFLPTRISAPVSR